MWCWTRCRTWCRTWCRMQCRMRCRTRCRTWCRMQCRMRCRTWCRTQCRMQCRMWWRTQCRMRCRTRCRMRCRTIWQRWLACHACNIIPTWCVLKHLHKHPQQCWQYNMKNKSVIVLSESHDPAQWYLYKVIAFTKNNCSWYIASLRDVIKIKPGLVIITYVVPRIFIVELMFETTHDLISSFSTFCPMWVFG